jgi:hypothetical protein
LAFVETKFPFGTPYFSSLGVPVWHKKSNRAAAAKESQEILLFEPQASLGFQKINL